LTDIPSPILGERGRVETLCGVELLRGWRGSPAQLAVIDAVVSVTRKRRARHTTAAHDALARGA